MKNIKKTLSFVLLLVFAFSMLVFGCGDKYANLKVTTDVPEEGITLYIGKDTENDVLSKATFVATVSGAGEDISTNLKYHLSKDIVDVTYINLGVETEFTVSATNYGSTTMTILTEEGRKSTEVIINVVKEIQDLNLYSSYKPYVFAGDSSYIDTAQAIDFVPADTSQRSVTYSMVGSYDGVTIQPNGKIIATEDAQSGKFYVIATSIDNPSITSEQIEVRVFKSIKPEDVTISINDGRENLILSTSVIPEEVFKVVTLNINTAEQYIVDEPTFTSTTGDLIEVEQIDNNNFKITGVSAGTGVLTYSITLVDGETIYQSTTFDITQDVQVIQYATKVSLNGISEPLDDLFLYDTYQNQRGEKFQVTVGEDTAEDKRFVVALGEEDQQKVTIVDPSNNVIRPYVEGGEYDILDNNSTVFIRIKEGYDIETTVAIHFYAYGTLGLSCDPISNTITAQLKHGVKEIVINPTQTLHEEKYLVANGMEYIIPVEIPKDQFTSYVQTKVSSDVVQIQDKIVFDKAVIEANKTTFYFVLKGINEGICSIEFVAENGISKTLNFRVYNPINAFQITSQTVNQNSNIGEVKYETPVLTNYNVDTHRSSLSKIAISLNGEVQLGIIPVYFDGNRAYNVDTKYIVETKVSASDYVTILSNNTLVAKKLTGDSTQTITVNMSVFSETGILQLPEQTIQVEVFYDIKDVYLDTTHTVLYTYDDLANADKNLATHEFTLNYYDGVQEQQIPAEEVMWQKGGQDKSSIELTDNIVTAKTLSGNRNSGLATLTAIYVRYGRTYIKEANIEIIKAEKIRDIYNLSYTKDNKTTLIPKQTVVVSQTEDGEDIYSAEPEYYIYLDARNSVTKGTTFSLGQTIMPENAYNKTLIYRAENAVEGEAVPVLLVDENGIVTINRTGGTAFIYISAKDSLNDDGTYGIERRIFVKIADGNSAVTSLEISNEYDLLAINNNIESLTKYYHITNDINLSNLTSNTSWTPIGVINGEVHEFSGNINGKIITKGETYICTISGFNINLQSSAQVLEFGLFAKLSQQSVISNVNLSVNKVNLNHTANDADSVFSFGGLCAVNNGQIKNVSVEFIDTNSQITECAYNSNIGGLVGVNNGKITTAYADGTINHIKQNSLNTSNTSIGGLVGLNQNIVDGNSKLVNDKNFADSYTSLIAIDSSFYNQNNIKTYNEITGNIAVGGVIGQNNKTAQNLSFDGSIKAINNVGGVVGKNNGSLTNCFASGYVNGFNNVGGLVGSTEQNSTIDFCAVNMFDDYDITYTEQLTPNIIARYDNVGGLVGSVTDSQITNSYVKTYFVRTTSNYLGDIYVQAGANAHHIGGLVGFAQNSSISICYAQLTINTQELDAYVGGLVGGADNISIENCYTMGSFRLNNQNTNSVAGKMIGLLASNSILATSYSTITDESATTNTFVGKTENGTLIVASSFHLSSSNDAYAKTSDKLIDINTYAGWSISTTLSDTIWYINADNNNGYPMLVYDANKLGIEAPNSISVTLNESNDNMLKLTDTSAILWRGSESLSVYLINSQRGLFNSIAVEPQDAGMAYKVTSSDQSILRIMGRNNDRIVPVTNGIATLTITSRLNNTAFASVTVYVVNKIENFVVNKTEISSLVNQRQTVELSAKNTNNYKLNIKIYGGNNQYININNNSYENGEINLNYTNRLYIHSTKSIATPVTIEITPYIVVADQKIYIDDQKQYFTYSSYYGIKDFSCNLKNIDITDNDSARLVYTATGDDLRVDGGLPELTLITEITGLQDTAGILYFVKVSTVAYDSAGNILIDYSNTEVAKIVYEYVLKVDKVKFNQKLALSKIESITFDITTSISLSLDKTEQTYADTVTNVIVAKQQLKKIGVEFFTDSQKIKNETTGEEEFTINEASSHKIVAGKTGTLKISLYPQKAEVKEVRVYSVVNGNNNISMAQLLKKSVNANGKTSYTYVERKPYAINLVDKNGLVLWQESNITDNSILTKAFDGSLYVGFTIPSMVAVSTSYIIYVEADLKDGRTLVQPYELYSDIPSEVSISYDFEGLQTIKDKAYIAYNVQHTLTVEVAKLTVEELSNGTGIKDLTLNISCNKDNSGVCDHIKFVYDSVLISGGFSYIRYNFVVEHTDSIETSDGVNVTDFTIFVTMQKVVNGQLTTFKSNEMIFNLRPFIIKQVDIKTDNNNSDTLALATNNKKSMMVILDCQYADYTLVEGATEKQIAYTQQIKQSIFAYETLLSRNLNNWQAIKSASTGFSAIELCSYENFKFTQSTLKNADGTEILDANNKPIKDYIVLQPIKASSGETIYFAVSVDYDVYVENNVTTKKIEGADLIINNTTISAPQISSTEVNSTTGFVGSKQTLISKVTTNFFRDISAKNAIPVGDLLDNADNSNNTDTQVGEIDFLEIQNGTEEGKLYYRLKEDIVLENYTPFDLSYVDLDGNGYTITIKSFSEEAMKTGTLGLFTKIDNHSMLQNINVVYDLTKTEFDYTTSQLALIQFGGVVAENNGIIYNCKISGTVGIKSLASAEKGASVYVGGLSATNAGTISFSQSSLTISINRGYVGGLVAQNSGRISNSKVVFTGTGLTNIATTELMTTVGGFVAINSGKIYGSYISGTTLSQDNGVRYTDSISSYTPIGAFVNSNRGEIHNSYANIKVDCQTRSSGFVYDNSGTIQSCYTASQMAQNSSAHNPFTGVNETGLNNSGSILDCYYLTDSFGSTSQEPAAKLTSLTEKANFAQFVFADEGELNGIWTMTSKAPQLVDADLTIVSEQDYNGLVIDTDGKETYSWSFKTEGFTSGKRYLNPQTGSYEYNFRTITDFDQFNTQIYYKNDNDYTTNDYFVLLCDITCQEFVLPNSAEMSFGGTLVGNNMTISNLYLKASNDNTNQYFGLFGEIKGGLIKDLNIVARQCVANNTSYVGILAGRITDNSDITNITIDGSTVYVQGKFFVGGLAGYIKDSTVRKISVATTVNASYRGNENKAQVFDNITEDASYKFTYSGVATGVLTGNSIMQDVTITGESIAIGYYASACVGLVDKDSILSLANVVIDYEQYVRAYYVAGGVVAENRGLVEGSKIEHEQEIQQKIDTQISYTNQRNLTFFAGSPQIVGGLVGFNNGGSVKNSYSKLDVRPDNLATKVSGGLIGTIIGGTVENCYATGSVLGRRVLGGLIGSVTTESSICYDESLEQANTSAIFVGDEPENNTNNIEDSSVVIKNVFASNRWLNNNETDINVISAAFQKGLLVGCFNRNTDISLENCFVNTQITENTIKNDINKFVTNNNILTAFNGGIDALTSVDAIKNLCCGQYTPYFDGTSIGGVNTDCGVKISNSVNGDSETYITFYFLNNYDANMNIISSNRFAPPTKDGSIYATIVKNLNLDI